MKSPYWASVHPDSYRSKETGSEMDRDSWIAVLQIVKMVPPILPRQGLLAISELGIDSSISSSEGSSAICF